ncbi:hypothetical protein Lesp01_90080 [Lentzea sp. NBRC 102530]|nr:hypothetical protein Lesp01_90080 [Lentzea sp. NBRC 102530]
MRRIVKVPQLPNMAAVAGKAFHSWTEEYDTQELQSQKTQLTFEWPDFLAVAVEEEEESSGVERDRFTTFGRRTKERPNKEDFAVWRDDIGPDLVEKYVAWAGNHDLTIAQDLPQDANGKTYGVEYELSFRIGQTPELGYADRIFYDVDGNLGVVDIKTGRKRKTTQLPLYLIALQQKGIPAVWCAYYQARDGKMTEPWFPDWDEHRMSYLHEQAAAMQALGFYLPNPGDECGWCSVRDHCQFAL